MVSHRVATSRLHALRRLKPRQDEHTWGRPLHTPCNATRSPADHWERAWLRGRLVRKTARHGRLLSACGVSSTRFVVPDGTRHPGRVVIRSNATSASGPWGDCRTPGCHTQLWVCAQHNSAPHRASLVPCWDLSCHHCYTLHQAGRGEAMRPPSMHDAPAKEANHGYCRHPAISA